MRLAAAAGGGSGPTPLDPHLGPPADPDVADPSDVDLPTEAFDVPFSGIAGGAHGDPLHMPRPLIIGGALTSAALSIAGAAFVAWRRSHRGISPMARAVRAVERSRLGQDPLGLIEALPGQAPDPTRRGGAN